MIFPNAVESEIFKELPQIYQRKLWSLQSYVAAWEKSFRYWKRATLNTFWKLPDVQLITVTRKSFFVKNVSLILKTRN